MSRHVIGRPMEILLVEDSPIDARLTMAALKRSGVPHRLTLMRDGAGALDFLFHVGIFTRAPRPDLVLLDLLLPKKDGFEVLDAIRADDNLHEIPIVILTGAGDEDIANRIALHEVEYFLKKPVDFDAFLDIVKRLRSYWRDDLILPALD